MSDHDRGAYTPPSERLSFDPREPVRSGGPAPVTLIVSGLVLIAILGGVFLLYKGGTRHKGEGPTVVGTPIAQMKTPAAPDANALPPGLVIDKAGPSNMTAANTVSAYAPLPEQPLPRPLPVAEAPVAQALPPPLPRTAPPTPVAAQPPPHAVKPVTIASLTDAAMAQKPAAKAPAPPPPPPMITPPPVVATTAASPPAGQGWVQIGAYSSAALADKGWTDVAHLAPAAMGGKGKRVEQLSKDGKTLYRAYITGFSSRDAATAFCGKLKAGGRACFVK